MGRKMTTSKLDTLDRALARAYKPNRHLDGLLVLREADPARWAALDHALRIAAETHERMRDTARRLREDRDGADHHHHGGGDHAA